MMTQAVPRFEVMDIDRGVSGLLGMKQADLLDAPVMKVSTGIWWMLVGVKELERLKNVRPDYKAIEELSRNKGITGITPFCLETFNTTYQGVCSVCGSK